MKELAIDHKRRLARGGEAGHLPGALVDPEYAVDGESSSEERAPADVRVAHHLHDTVGNAIVAEALFAPTAGPLATVVAGDLGAGLIGIDGGAGAALGSNSAMQTAMRDAARGSDADESETEVSADARVASALQRGGQPLPGALRARLEAAFGRDLSAVRVHTDGASHTAAESVAAHAFTMGTDIVFGAGEYSPDTQAGQELIAHEVTHVVQALENRQGRATSVENGVGVTRPGDMVEVEAEAAGAAFVKGDLGGLASFDAAIDAGISDPMTSGLDAGQAVGAEAGQAVSASGELAARKADGARPVGVVDDKEELEDPQMEAPGEGEEQAEDQDKDKEEGEGEGHGEKAAGRETDAKEKEEGQEEEEEEEEEKEEEEGEEKEEGEEGEAGEDGEGGEDGDAPADGEGEDGDAAAPTDAAGAAGAGGPETGPVSGPVAPAVIPSVTFAALPQFTREEAEQHKERTGLTPQGNLDAIRRTVDEVKRHAASQQAALLSKADEIQGLIDTYITANVTALNTAAGAAESRVASAFRDGRSKVEQSGVTALEQLTTSRGTAASLLDGAQTRHLESLKTAFEGADGKLIELRTSMRAPFVDTINKKITDLKALGLKKSTDAVAKSKELAVGLRAGGGSSIERLHAKVKAQAMEKLGDARKQSIMASTKKRETRIAGQLLMVDALIDATLKPMTAELGKRRLGVESQIKNKVAAAKAKVETDGASAETTIGSAVTEATGRLSTQETQAVGSIRSTRDSTAGGLGSTGEQLKGGVREAATGLSARYASEIEGLQGLVDGISGLPDSGQMTPRILEVRKKIDTAFAEHQTELEGHATRASDQLSQSMQTGVEGLNTAASGRVTSATTSAQQLSDGVTAKGGSIQDLITQLTTQIEGQVAAFATPVVEAATAAEANAREALEGTRKGMDLAMQKQLDDFGKELDTQIGNLEKDIEKPAAKAISDVETTMKAKTVNLWDAMDGLGTDESGVFNALRGLDMVDAAALKWFYHRHYGGVVSSLEAHIREEMSGGDLAEALAHLSGNRVEATLKSLQNSVNWYGDDEKAIEDQLRLLSDEELKQLHEQCKSDPQAAAVIERVRNNLSGADLDVVDVLMDESVDKERRNIKADAIRVFEAMDGPGTDEDAVYGKLEGKTKEQLAAIQAEYASYSKKVEDREVQSLADAHGVDPSQITRKSDHSMGAAIKDDFSGAEEDLGIALMNDDKVGAKAARLEQAASGGLFGMGTDEKEIFKQLKDPALAPPKRDDPDYDTKYAAYQQAKVDRDALKARYQEKYGRSIESMIQSEMGDAKDTANYEAQIAGQFLSEGKADDDLMLKYAVDGPGTDEAMIRETLAGKSKAEIAELKRKYAQRFGGQGAPADLLDRELGLGQYSGWGAETSGKDNLDIEILMMGKPETPEEFQKIANMRHEFQRSGVSGSWMEFMGDIGVSRGAEQMDWQKGRLDSAIDTWKDDPKDPAAKGEVDEFFGYHQQDYESYEKVKNEVADAVVTGVEVVGLVIAVIVTDGAASPALAAFLASLGTGAAAMGTRALLQGNSYGWEAIATDGVKTLASAATAGLGNAKFMKSWAEGLVKNVKPGVIQKMMEESLQGLPGSVIDTMAGVMLDEKNWDNDAIAQRMMFTFLASQGGNLAGNRFKDFVGGDKSSYLGQMMVSGGSGAVGDVTKNLLDPATYTGDADDIFWKVAKSGGKSFGTGALSGAVTRSVRAKGVAKQLDRGDLTADQLSADFAHLSPSEKLWIVQNIKDPKQIPSSWKGEIMGYVMSQELDSMYDGHAPTAPVEDDHVAVISPVDDQQLIDEGTAGDGLGPNSEKKSVTPDVDSPTVVKSDDKAGTTAETAESSVNKASVADLEAVNGIGPKKAQLIADHIAKNGPITDVSQLEGISGIGPSTIDKLKAHFGTGASSTPAKGSTVGGQQDTDTGTGAKKTTGGEESSAAKFVASDETTADFKGRYGDERYKDDLAAINQARADGAVLTGATDEELVALRGYTSHKVEGDENVSDYKHMNAALRSGDDAALKEWGSYIETVSSALGKLPDYKGTVYRGTNLPDGVLKKYVAGETVTESSFLSTAVKQGDSFDGNTQYVIQSKTGSDIAPVSHYDESEVLFSPGTKFKVLKVDKADGVTTIYMNEV